MITLRKACFLAAVCIAISALCNNKAIAAEGPENVIVHNSTDENAALRTVLKSKGNLMGQVYRDFDGDGDLEMVALVQSSAVAGKVSDGSGSADMVYFVDGDKATLVFEKSEDDPLFYKGAIYAAKVKNGYIIVCESDYAATESLSYEWFINKKGEIKILPNMMMHLIYEGNNQFTALYSTYDMEFDDDMKFGIGHTWKNYDFYWNGKQFVEYGGKKISVNKLKSYTGGKKIVKEILAANSDYKISSIYYRNNGRINVNLKSTYEGGYSYRNVTLKITKGKLTYYTDYRLESSYGNTPLTRATNEGYYKKAVKIKGVKVEYPE